MNETRTLDFTADVEGFFREAVRTAVSDKDYRVSDAAAVYLGTLLADFTRPGQLERAAFDRPVTLLLAEALKQRGAERFERLRTLGDAVLYVGGFFGQHLTRRGAPRGYVLAVGARAYAHAGAMLDAPGHSSPDVLSELARDFEVCVSLLSDVADVLRADAARSDADVLDLYERWQRTRSSRLAHVLWSRGLMPTAGSEVLN